MTQISTATNSTRNLPIGPMTINGAGVITNVGAATISTGHIHSGNYAYTGQLILEKAVPTDPDLPSIRITGYDDQKNPVKMEVTPERSISAYESLQITMMLVTLTAGANDFNPLAFVKKNNLERHFSFS
jgi:hypothetical protein